MRKDYYSKGYSDATNVVKKNWDELEKDWKRLSQPGKETNLFELDTALKNIEDYIRGYLEGRKEKSESQSC